MGFPGFSVFNSFSTVIQQFFNSYSTVFQQKRKVEKNDRGTPVFLFLGLSRLPLCTPGAFSFRGCSGGTMVGPIGFSVTLVFSWDDAPLPTRHFLVSAGYSPPRVRGRPCIPAPSGCYRFTLLHPSLVRTMSSKKEI